MRSAFVLESPAVSIPWGLEEPGFRQLLEAHAQRVTSGHYRGRCTLLGGFEHQLDFHFKPRVSGRFFQVEIHRVPARRRKRNFDELQARLEAALGPGRKSAPGPDDVTPCEWRLGKLTVSHDYYYQFGLHERGLFTCTAV